ncbi:unnamed protein product [Gongylonema pulchrum]|uniref:C2H2-type domain-containing protein n=1 Tax=Gongylonema pulchrum TaxID=637853 RepID=A0A183ERF0_9BILA|nr:unnamed protein product [Gongylonema pulchrum]
MWQKCDVQADTSDALYEHIKTIHNLEYFCKFSIFFLLFRALLYVKRLPSLTVFISAEGEKRYACLWSTCFRNKRFPRSFSLLPHLQQHIKYKHLPRCARFITPDKKSNEQYLQEFLQFNRIISSNHLRSSGHHKNILCPKGTSPGYASCTVRPASLSWSDANYTSIHDPTTATGIQFSTGRFSLGSCTHQVLL